MRLNKIRLIGKGVDISIAKRVKVSNRTVEEDLKYLIRFELVKIKKIGQHKFYNLNVEF